MHANTNRFTETNTHVIARQGREREEKTNWMPKKEHLYVVVETVIEAMVPMIIQIARRIVAHVLSAVDDSRFRHGGDQ